MRRTKLAVAIAVVSGIGCLGAAAVAWRGEPRVGPVVSAPAAGARAARRRHVSVFQSAEPAAPIDSEIACPLPHINVGETSTLAQVHEFELTNVSQEQIRVTATKKSCGCVKRDLGKYELAPGESTKLKLDFPIRGKEGQVVNFIERLEVYVNDLHERPAAVLSVGGTYVPLAYRVGDGVHIELPPQGGPAFRGSIEV